MARLPLDLDRETFVALANRAIRERRPIAWQAEVMLREALGLTFPYPAGATRDIDVRQAVCEPDETAKGGEVGNRGGGFKPGVCGGNR